MNLPTRHALVGMALGALCATGLAAIGPGQVWAVLADEMPLGFNTGHLVKFDDSGTRYEDWVSTDPIETHSIKKIEAGKVSYVSITRTSTGTYSSDGLSSPHVLYPGIETEPNQRLSASFSSWSNGRWTQFSTFAGNSYATVSTIQRGLGNSISRTCISSKNNRPC